MESLQLIIVSESSPLHSGRKRKSDRLGALRGLTQERRSQDASSVWPSSPLHPVAQPETTPHCRVRMKMLYSLQNGSIDAGTGTF